MGLNGTNKTNITTVESAIDAALAGLNPNDTAQAGMLQVLRQMRRSLELFKVERTQ